MRSKEKGQSSPKNTIGPSIPFFFLSYFILPLVLCTFLGFD